MSEIKVFVRKKGKHVISLYFTDPLTGREVSRSAKTRDPDEAQRAAQRWETELKEVRGIDGCGWGYFRDRFRDEHLADKPIKTRRSYNNALNHFERIVSVASVGDVTTAHVSKVKGVLVDEGRPYATVANILTHCRSAFRWAERNGMLKKAPHVAMPKTVRRKFMRGRAIDDKEFRKMLKHCDAPYGKERTAEWRRFLELLRLSGLRLEEATRLAWDTPPIQVSPDAIPHPYLLFYGEGQKSGEDELVPITPAFAEWLRTTPRKERKGLVAPLHGLRGEQLTHDPISRFISDIGEAAEVFVSDDGKPASAHDLRRAFGREWAQKVKPLILQRLMRHKSINTTMKFYAQLDSEDIGSALWSDYSRKDSRKRGSNGNRSTRKQAEKGHR